VPNDDLHFWNITLGDNIGAYLSACDSFALVYRWDECSGEPWGPSRLWARGCRHSWNGIDPDSERQRQEGGCRAIGSSEPIKYKALTQECSFIYNYLLADISYRVLGRTGTWLAFIGAHVSLRKGD